MAVLDASLAYGASRWYRGIHQDQQWATKYKAADDKLLFYEFLHDLVLYDKIILDRSSVGEKLSTEILELFTKINTRTRETVLDASRNIAPITTLAPVVDAISKLLADLDQTSQNKTTLRDIPVPWAYSSETHVDRKAFIKAFEEWGVNADLLPLAVFLYRGICYAGFANNYSVAHSTPTIYLASPGRMKALTPVLSAGEIKKLQYPKHAYADLVSLLKLPTNGYSFTQFPSLPSHYLSQLAQQIHDRNPREALDYVIRMRMSAEAADLRRQWGERVWEHSKSAAIGPVYSQTVSGATITGDLTMVIHAAAE